MPVSAKECEDLRLDGRPATVDVGVGDAQHEISELLQQAVASPVIDESRIIAVVSPAIHLKDQALSDQHVHAADTVDVHLWAKPDPFGTEPVVHE